MARTIGEVVRSLRIQRGWGTEHLGRLMNLSNSSISRKETGEIQIKPAEQERFAEVFGMDLDEFLALCEWTDGRGVKTKGIPVINMLSAGEVIDYTNDQCGAAEYHDPWYELDRGRIGDPDAFACVVVGDSMEPSIRAGDFCVFSPVIEDKPESHPKPGSVVFVLYNEEAPKRGACLARWFPDDESHWTLVKDNRAYPPRRVNTEWVGRYGVLIEHRKAWV